LIALIEQRSSKTLHD